MTGCHRGGGRVVLLWEGCSYSVPEVIIRSTSVSGSHVPEYDSFNRFSAVGGDNDVLGWASRWSISDGVSQVEYLR